MRFVALPASVFLVLLLLTSGARAEGDDFNDNTKDTAKWSSDVVFGNGTLTETNGRLEWTVANPTNDDETLRPWIGTVMTADVDFNIEIDVSNTSVPAQDDQVSSYGIEVFNAADLRDSVYVENYASRIGGPPLRRGFYTEMNVDDVFTGAADIAEGVSAGRLRLNHEAATGIVTSFYDLPGGGTEWIELATFGTRGTGGGEGNGSWGMGSSSAFAIAVYGFSGNDSGFPPFLSIASGEMFGDNFSVTVPEPALAAQAVAVLAVLAGVRARRRHGKERVAV